MKKMMIATLMLMTVNVSASVSASDYTCKQLKALIKQEGQLTINTRLGSYVVYAKNPTCDFMGVAKYVSVRASDKWCTVGLECSPSFGN